MRRLEDLGKITKGTTMFLTQIKGIGSKRRKVKVIVSTQKQLTSFYIEMIRANHTNNPKTSKS